jgi:DNA replication and repair protein RecF
MALTRLTLTNFRCYDQAVVHPGPGIIVLTGDNGAGKTNLLEAISLLAPGRGLRGAAPGDVTRQGGPGGFGVAAMLGDITLATGTLAAAPERRVVRINGAQAAANTLSEWLSVIWLTPAMDRLFADGAGERRRFLDRLVLALTPAHAFVTARYDAAMRQRNRLLGEDGPRDETWLSALEAQMAEHGVALMQHRTALVETLSTSIGDQPEGPFARAGLALDGWTGDDAQAFQSALAAGRSRDAAAGRTLAGPHRCDLNVTHIAKAQPAARCSTGEQKALLLGIILAHAKLVADRHGRRPILLLDEVAAHLDPVRRAALFVRLEADGGQVWMTGTEAQLFSELGQGATRLTVVNGRIVGG